MKRWALIVNNIINNVTEQNTKPIVFLNGNSFWVDITEKHVGPGYKYNDGIFLPPDPPPVILNRLEYINKLENSYPIIISTSKTDVEVEVWLEKFRLTETFNMSESTTISDVQFLVTKNLITQDKANEIINNG